MKKYFNKLQQIYFINILLTRKWLNSSAMINPSCALISQSQLGKGGILYHFGKFGEDSIMLSRFFQYWQISSVMIYKNILILDFLYEYTPIKCYKQQHRLKSIKRIYKWPRAMLELLADNFEVHVLTSVLPKVYFWKTPLICRITPKITPPKKP